MTQIQKWPKIKNDQKPIMSQIQKWPKIKSRSDATALRAEGAQADVRSALHSPDHPPFFVFLSFSCFYIYCGSMCSMGSMWVQQSYSAVLHFHLWWYYCCHTWSIPWVQAGSCWCQCSPSSAGRWSRWLSWSSLTWGGIEEERMLAMLRFNLAALIILVSAKGQHLLEIIEQVVGYQTLYW